jgi:hypothetical protein
LTGLVGTSGLGTITGSGPLYYRRNLTHHTGTRT